MEQDTGVRRDGKFSCKLSGFIIFIFLEMGRKNDPAILKKCKKCIT